MARKEAAAAPPVPTAALTRTFALAVPIKGSDSLPIREITLCEPELRHATKVDRKKTSTQTEHTIATLAELSGQPEDVIRRLRVRDAGAMRHWLEDIARQGLTADALAEAADADYDPAKSPRVFHLLVPVATDAAPLTQATVAEPTIESGIAVEKMSTPAEQTAAMIAACTGLTIPLVLRMAMRDIRRIERWLDFFFSAGGDTFASSPAVAVDAGPAGATSR